ncbi:carbon-nitrogen hydrolase family protein [Marinomonas sp. M1K-6]|uniref:Carbon-nitrogen hydrolase family protein n=2 Tax=Marinomonas profundi TaxID=2726122 RepID=A0A847R4J6_9GAMM|nr:carbon-nitrogen hydrolase family protein [Marinomonas profundi]UDV04897.1 carbon-nitrogen hydrolase family protein [Marinomonas profundi]
MQTLCIAAVQLTSTGNWQDNLNEVKELVASAVAEGARLVVLPENVFLFDGKRMRSFAESDEQDVLLNEIAELARQHSIYLVIGSHPSILNATGDLVAGGRVRQTCWAVGPDGLFFERYDKIHLFDVDVNDKAMAYRESEVIEPGDLTPKVIDVDGFKVGLSICYDVRFPELYRELSRRGADLLLVPAAFTYMTGKKHWDILLAARAIENQCYVLGVNQCGWHNATRQTYGHSGLYSPTGERLLGLQEVPGYFVFKMTKQALLDCRQKMPCLAHRRLS